AITGTTTAYLTRQVTYWLDLDASSAWYWIIKVGMLIFGYQVLILLFSIPFGQFKFFWRYEKKILSKMGLKFSDSDSSGIKPFHIVLFASGAGSNAQKIIDHFRHHPFIKVSLIVCNKPGAGVLGIAERENIPSLIIEKEKFFRGNAYVDELKKE